MGMRLEGMSELVAQLEKIGARAKDVEEEALKAGAEVVKEEAKSLCPEKTGSLKRSITTSKVANGKIEIGPDKEHFYSLFVEFGTSKMSAKPFLQPAFEQNVERVKNTMANVIRRELGL